MFVTRVTVYPDTPTQDNGAGGFAGTSFADLLHREIHLPGLDPAWTHTLVDVAVAGDRCSADLTIHSTPIAPLSLDRHLRVVTWAPPAHVRAHNEAGDVLAEIRLDAPLQPGQLVEVGGQRHRVTQDITWPGRDPVSGTCHSGLDWQHVVVRQDPQPPHLPTAAD